MTDFSYIGKGTIYMETGTGGLVAVGNCSKLTLTTEEEKKELPDYTSAGGGNASSISRIKGVSMAFTAHDISPANLSIATRGAIDVYAGGAVTDEDQAAIVIGGLVVLDNIPDPDSTMTVVHGVTAAWAGTTAKALGAKILDGGRIYVVTVAGTTGGSEPIWPTDNSTVEDGTVTWDDLGVVALTENTDYTRVGAGIIPIAGKLATGDAVVVSYTGLADNMVQALSESGLEYRLVFDGLNEAQSGRKVVVEAYRVKPSPSGLDFLGDEYAGLEITADVLKDASITAAGKSQYFTVKMATA
jgi:hypothetical protein